MREFNIKATRKDYNLAIVVRRMDADEMPDNGITYYCQDSGQIYEEQEIEIINENPELLK